LRASVSPGEVGAPRRPGGRSRTRRATYRSDKPGAWATAKSAEDKASAERLGIFVGLWAPTFWEIGNALKVDEK
jgi:hypothetical protein